MKIEIFKANGIRRWHWRSRACNGEPTSSSQGYTRRTSARRAGRRQIAAMATPLLRPARGSLSVDDVEAAYAKRIDAMIVEM